MLFIERERRDAISAALSVFTNHTGQSLRSKEAICAAVRDLQWDELCLNFKKPGELAHRNDT